MGRCHARATDRTAAAADVLDHQGLPKDLSHLVGHDAGHHVARTTGGEWHHYIDGSDRIAIFCPIPWHDTGYNRRNAEESNKRHYEKLSTPHKTIPAVTTNACITVGPARHLPPATQLPRGHYGVDATAMIAPMAIMQHACRKNNAKRSVAAALVGGVTMCITVCPTRAPNMVTARPSMVGLLHARGHQGYHNRGIHWQVSTQFMCARIGALIPLTALRQVGSPFGNGGATC